MNHQLHLEIKKPCAENYDRFRSTDKGGFCDACKKEVIDFTKLSDEAIAKHFTSQTSENTCGRFTNQQLQTTYKRSQKNRLFSILTGLGMAILAFFSIASAEAQELETSSQLKNDNKDTEAQNTMNTITVTGTVTTKSDGLPLPGASVVLEGTAIGVQTDFDGYFKFPKQLKKGDVLIITYIGLDSKKVIIENKRASSNLALSLEMDETLCVLVGEVAVKEIFKSTKN